MDTFQAISEPTRRDILQLLSNGKKSSTEISENFHMSAPAISQHLKVLREANLLQMEKQAQKHIYKINPQAKIWIKKMMMLWNTRFDNLEDILKK